MEILFRKTIEQCRQLGARGGRAHARNLRLRQSQPPLPPVAEIPGPPSETAHEASLRLDAQFPWLAAAFARRPTRRCSPDGTRGLVNPEGGKVARAQAVSPQVASRRPGQTAGAFRISSGRRT